MSKIPPQGCKPLRQIFGLFGGEHGFLVLKFKEGKFSFFVGSRKDGILAAVEGVIIF